MLTKIVQTHISNIKAGDTVEHKGTLKTVSKSNIKNCLFYGGNFVGRQLQLRDKTS